ncbi:metallophosphoesterase YmdB [Mycoplasma haemofelis str. Langford 1]|uniref:Metallophosphoesterase YmdB n=1 Tax=Mycoplasma haemofelis (strain Langford 1) TaxID=941640 RepID=E8ZKA9_MYCHL|nr:TIGR00282 family metallophosphoesterase [Mycoplasma haemofelis]CBY92075.1 metallophosphoesterase YmdB [Mycoplasma haemofelis str. Langford 1]
MKILFVGDIFGSPGRKIIEAFLPTIKEDEGIDLVIANAENSAHGKGLTPKIFRSLINSGVDFVTMGNHTWFRNEVLDILNMEKNIVRPLNLSENFPHFDVGFGSRELEVKGLRIRITNLLGSSVRFKNFQTNPFIVMENLLADIEKPDIHIVDFHAETTSEKYAFLWAFNGKVDAILGTHTHVPTNDAQVTEENTAFICDVGMTGPSKGVIGGERNRIIKKFFDPSSRFILEVQEGPSQLSSVILNFDESIGKMTSITPLLLKRS